MWCGVNRVCWCVVWSESRALVCGVEQIKSVGVWCGVNRECWCVMWSESRVLVCGVNPSSLAQGTEVNLPDPQKEGSITDGLLSHVPHTKHSVN